MTVPSIMRARRWEDERNAAASLHTLASAEADFRANDRDWNGILDFWTADVQGLYYLQAQGRSIRLIDRSVAEADTRPFQAARVRARPFRGHYFRAMDRDESMPDPEEYRQETDGSAQKLHHLGRFGFCAYPVTSGNERRNTFIINEGNSLFKRQGTRGPLTAWPSDQDLKWNFSRAG